ncbi:MAG TPA: hypothetical protein VHT24_04695, partial [Pseudacidobacterium sp.]|nr:hypothetical protein [Pseudacidobacterium sp.]
CGDSPHQNNVIKKSIQFFRYLAENVNDQGTSSRIGAGSSGPPPKLLLSSRAARFITMPRNVLLTGDEDQKPENTHIPSRFQTGASFDEMTPRTLQTFEIETILQPFQRKVRSG